MKRELTAYAALLVLLLVILPLGLDVFRLNIVGRYVSMSFVAVGLVLVWGYCGILSLGQGIFFGIGGYVLAMFLKLEVSRPELPEFMVWSSVEKLPIWWEPFNSVIVTLLAIVLIPAVLAFLFGYAFFRRRVSGVYIAIVTLALAFGLTVLLIGSQGVIGGFNGINAFSTFKGFNIIDDTPQVVLYYISVILLAIVVAIAFWMAHSRFGRILIAIRDQEDRVRFSGYNTAMFRATVFAVGAVFAAIGGAMFTIQAGVIAPSSVGVMASVEMVVYAAVGGRKSIPGAIVGALLVGWARSYLSENFPEIWLFFLGAIYILVVLAMPEGVAGLMNAALDKFTRKPGSESMGASPDTLAPAVDAAQE